MGTFAAIMRLLKIVWPFILEAVAGKRLGFMEAYKTRPRSLFTAIVIVIVVFIGMAATARLYTMSKEIIELKAEVEMYKTGKAAPKTIVATSTPTPVVEVLPTPIPSSDNRHDTLRDALDDIDPKR